MAVGPRSVSRRATARSAPAQLPYSVAGSIRADASSAAQARRTVFIGPHRLVFAKAGLIADAGAGRGVLTYGGLDYPFRVYGLSVGVTDGASAMWLTGASRACTR